MQFLCAEERERLRVFLLADSNPVPVLLVKMPSETKAAKAFLGYEWSAHKGNEGIKVLGSGGLPSQAADDEDDAITRNRGIEAIQTPLFDNAHLANEEAEKINSLVRKNFRGTLSSIPESLRPFARTVPLADLLDFDAETFDRQIRTGVSTPIAAVQSKFPLVRLGDVAEIKKGKAITAAECHPGSVKVVAGGKAFACLHDVANTPPDVITVSASGAYAGFVNYWREPIWASDCSTIRGSSSAETGYLFACLSGMQGRMYLLQRGAAQPHVYPKDLANLTIPLPPLSVKQKVVDACEKVDAECAAAEKAITDSRAKIAAIMANVHGNRKPLASLLVKVAGNTTKIQERSIRENGTIPVVTQERDRFVAGFTETAVPISDVPLVLFGDHSCAVKYIDFPFVRGADGTQLLKTDSSILLPRFLCEFLKTVKLEHEGKYERHFKYLKNVPVPVPPLSEQEKIVAAVETEEAAISAAKQVLASAAGRKRTILSAFGILQEQE